MRVVYYPHCSSTSPRLALRRPMHGFPLCSGGPSWSIRGDWIRINESVAERFVFGYRFLLHSISFWGNESKSGPQNLMRAALCPAAESAFMRELRGNGGGGGRAIAFQPFSATRLPSPPGLPALDSQSTESRCAERQTKLPDVIGL